MLVQLCHFGRQRADLVVLGDVVRCLPQLIALIAQATELLNLVGILSKAGRLEDDSAAPSRCSGSGFGVRGAAGSARLGPAGLWQRSLARHLIPGQRVVLNVLVVVGPVTPHPGLPCTECALRHGLTRYGLACPGACNFH